MATKDKTNLNEKDAEIAQLLSEGYTTAEVAAKFKVSLRTLEGRIVTAKKKALAHTLPHLVANYFRKGLIK